MENLQKFFTDILNQLEKEDALSSVKSFFYEELNSFKERMDDNIFKIAVVGEFSSGKSTFINALIGRDILSHATKETTAVLTRIVNVSQDDERQETAVALMRDGKKIFVKNLDELKEYTTAVSSKYNVALEVEMVEIYMPVMQSEKSLMIMDTPGLNGTAEGHLEQTIDIVKKAHACIYLIQQRGLTKDDLNFMNRYLVPYQHRFIFIQNFIDEFSSVENETVADRMEYLNKVLMENIFNDKPSHSFFICGVSALKELAARDKKIKRLYADSLKDLTDEERVKLAEESGFFDFRKIMNDEFSGVKLDYMQHAGTAKAIYYWCLDLLKKVDSQLNEDKEIYKVIAENESLKKLELRRQKIIDGKTNHLMAVRGFIAGERRKIEKEVSQFIDDDTQNFELELFKDLNSLTNIESVERKQNNLSQEINRFLENFRSKAMDYCKISFQLLYQLLQERVEEYTSIRSSSSGKIFQMKSLPTQPIYNPGNHIATLEQDIRQEEKRLSDERSNFQKQNSYLSSQEREFRSLENEARNAQWKVNQKRDEIRRLGQRPSERVWYEDVAVERSGFFGWVADCFSTKYETRRYTDDSAGEAWDRQRRQLQEQQNSFVRQSDDLSKQKAAAERILNRYKVNAEESREKVQSLQNKIHMLEERLELERQKERAERENARKNYVRMCVNQIRDSVEKYFHGDNVNDGELQRLKDSFKNSISTGEKDIFAEYEKTLDETINQKLFELEQAKKGIAAPLQKKIQGLGVAKEKLEGYLQQMEVILNG